MEMITTTSVPLAPKENKSELEMGEPLIWTPERQAQAKRLPPNEVWVEVKQGPKWIKARAIWGRDGTLPHWETGGSDGWSSYPPDAFREWREIPAKTRTELIP